MSVVPSTPPSQRPGLSAAKGVSFASPASPMDTTMASTPTGSVREMDEISLEGELPDLAEAAAATTTTTTSPFASSSNPGEITLLGELVGARNLQVHDEDQLRGGSSGGGGAGGLVDDIDHHLRPYAVIKFAGRRIHRTAPCTEEGPNPIWVPSTKSLFLLRTTAREISRSSLNISLYSKEGGTLPVSLMRRSNIFLGQLNLDASTILEHCDEDRVEFNLEDEIGEETKNLGKLALRFRVATPSDMNVVAFFNKKAKSMNFDESQRELVDMMMDPAAAAAATSLQAGPFQKNAKRPLAPLVTETSEAEIAQSGFVNALTNVFTRNVQTDKETGAKQVRVKPYPDPKRPHETEFLSLRDLKVETRLPSTQWVEAGSGGLGKLYVEILSCHDLPNVDMGEAVGNVTDAFCSVVFEDSCCMTDVIDDELSPHWMPWTERAFVFNIIHPASNLYIGCFDFDLGIGNHEAIGRVAVNVSNLQRDTVHTLKYNLYPSSNVTDRTPNGSITIRLRIEWFDLRAALLKAVKPRPKMHVNVTKEKSFRVIRYTCFGEYDNEEKFDLTVTRSYVNEILGYKNALQYVAGDSVRSLMFWRGQVEIFNVMLPIHSMLFFIMATRLVECPSLIAPFSLLGVAWAMLANLTVRRQHPSPWNRCPSYFQYLEVLWTGRASLPVANIKEHEGAAAAEDHELAWKKRMDEDREMAEKKAKLAQEINDIGDDNIHTQVSQGVIPLDLLLRLARYQGIIRRLCDKLRFVKIIANWEETVISFWVTTAFLAAGIVSLVLPWGFILLWSGRIIVWGLFGPHMKLVDLTLRANTKSDDSLGTLMKNFDIQKTIARRRREEALKIKDIKEAAFGLYSVQVPSFNLARHYDRPLPESSARICRTTQKKTSGRNSRRISVVELQKKDPWIPGQQLYGQMIPRPQFDADVYELEALSQQKILQKFRKRVMRIKDAEGLSDIERQELLKLGHLEGSPMAFGFEVVPIVDNDESTNDDGQQRQPGKSAGSRVAVKMTSDKRLFIAKRDLHHVILESDGHSTYCVSDHCPEEAGLEVIGTGRFATNVAEGSSETLDDELRATDSEESLVGAGSKELAKIFSCTDHVQVALYRPIECGNGEKQKEE